MTKTDQILYYLARIESEPNIGYHLQELSENGIDWEQVVTAAHNADLSPLMHHHFQKLEDTLAISDTLRARLRRDYMETTARNIVLQGELVKLLKAYTAENIEVIVLKGAALINGVYPKMGLRPMADLDILIHREDLKKAQAIAEPLGYDPDTAEDLHEGYGEEFRNELTLIRRGSSPIRIELHWQLLNFGDESSTLKGIWESAVECNFDGAKAKVLSPEHFVIHLAEHLAYHHNLEGILRYCDVAEVIRCYQNELNWDRLLSLARQGRSLLAMRDVLQQAQDKLGAPVPADFLQRLSQIKPSFADRTFYRLATNPNMATIARAMIDFQTTRGLGRKFNFLWAKICPSRECLLQRWPVKHPILVYTLYPKRWGQLIFKGCKGVFQLIRFFIMRCVK